MDIEFIADKVTIKTGKVDNSATVSFDVGEYQLEAIKELIGIVDEELKVSVKVEK